MITRAAGVVMFAGLALAGAQTVLFGSRSPGAQTNPAPPPYLRLLAATIAEGPPFEAAALAQREVRFRLVMAGAPPCGTERSDVTYDFLLDARPWQRGGVNLAAIREIKAGARLTFSCDRARGQFAASVPGMVTLEPLPDPAGAHALEVRTRLRELPAVEFAWVAVARERDFFTRLPESGAFGVWRIYERAMK